MNLLTPPLLGFASSIGTFRSTPPLASPEPVHIMKPTSRNLLLSLLLLGACGSSSKPDTASAVAPEAASAEPAAAELPSAESILDRALEASGGADSFAAVKSFKLMGNFEIPAQKIAGTLEILGAEGRRFAMGITIPGIGVERSGSDGTTVWSMSAMTGARILTGPERDRVVRDADLLRDLNWKTYYKSAKTTGTEDVDGAATYVVEMVDTLDTSEARYYSKDTGHLVRQTGTVKSQMGEMKSTSTFSNYKELGGLTMPATVQVEVMGMKQVLTLTGAEVNGEMPADAFALPADIAALSPAK